MLRAWPLALVAATRASRLFAFGVIQSAFAPQAQALFLAFAALLALFVLFSAMFGARRSRNGHGDRAVKISGSLVGMLTIVAGVLAIVFFWTENELNVEKIGREIDRGAVAAARQAQTAFERISGQRDDTPDPA